MNEININIEGYNVNGICVGCLNYNRKMFYSNNIKECFKLLANIDVPDGLTIQVCWECLSAVRLVEAFQKQIQNSYDVLIKYSKEHTFLNSPSDLTKHATQRLSITPVSSDDYPQILREPVVDFDSARFDDIPVKNEVEIEFENNFEGPKEEPPNIDDVEFPEVPVTHDSQSSDDDIQLSELKWKEEKKEKKSKKSKKDRKRKSHKEANNASLTRDQRKLKNLSEDLVQLHTMSDEEMWRVRSEDIASKEFRKLKYKCEDCVLTFNTQKLMVDHMNGKHKKKGPDSHQCDVCKAYFLTKDNLSTHRSLHLTAYSCVQCDFKTTLKRVMLKHCRVHSANNTEYRTCNSCGSVFSSKSKLSYHRGICHQEKPQCDCCGKVFANKMTLKYHLKILPLNKEEKPKEKLFLPCKGCDKIFHSRKSYRAHVVIHDGLTYPCQICGKLFQWKRNLARHMRNHREKDAGALHECRECGKSFSSRDCYNNHMRLSKKHVDEDAYVHECNYCGKKFATKWCMVDHIDWDHLKTIKYQCSFCFKAFKTAKIMVAHVNNLHQGKKKEPEGEHLCEICGKSYKTVKRLKGHVWAMHTNRSTAKSFKCKLCPATFTWQTSIYKHMKMMHDNKKKPSRFRDVPPQNKKPEPYTEQANRTQSFQQNLAIVPNIVNNLVPNIVTNIVSNNFVLGI